MLGLLGHVALASAAGAQALLPPPEHVCVGQDVDGNDRRILDPRRLVSWALSTSSISDAALDTNGDGDTLFTEKQLALTRPDYCGAAPARGCTEADAAELRTLHEGLADFVRIQGGALYRFERIRRPDPLDAANAPALDPAFEIPGQEFQLGEALDPAARFVRIQCLDADAGPWPEPEPEPEPQDLPAEAAVEPPSLIQALLGGFRLSRDIDDLSKDRSRLRDVKAAEFSITGNLREGETSYYVNAVAGYQFTMEHPDQARISTVPFVQFERFFDGTRNRVDKLGLGLQVAASVQAPTVGIHEVAVSPIFITDTDLEAAIGALKGRWTPALTEDAPVPLGFYRRYGPILASIAIDALVDSGRVFDPGDNPSLEESAFLRVGGQIALRLSGAPETLLSQIEIDIANKYLYNLNAEVRHIERFEAGISYLFPGLENYKLSFRYTTGRTDDTLDRIEFWKGQLGIRF